MSLVKASNIQIGQDVSATNNFVLSAPANGSITLGVGNSGAVTNILTVTSGGALSLAGNATLGTNTANTHTINGSLSITQNLSSVNLTATTLITTVKSISTNAGTSASTSIQLVSAGNGIFAPVTNSLGFSTAGSEALRIDATNNFSRAIPGGTVLYPDFACRAWVSFNGTGTVTIRSGGNVSSVTDNGTGDYSVNFTTAMPDANYAFTFGGYRSAANDNVALFGTATTPTTSSIRIKAEDLGGTSVDPEIYNVAIFR